MCLASFEPRLAAVCCGMGEEAENKYVSQLKDVYNSCDTTGTGYLDKEELTELCRKLHLERQLPVLLQTLLGRNHFARVNFEEFKEGFVAVLSSNIDLGISDEESSYLEPAVPDDVKPKYVNGAKWYGRWTKPELQETEVETTKYLQDQQVKASAKSQLRRSASLESVESLKSDEEAESAKESQNEMLAAQGQMSTWNPDLFDSPRRTASPCFDMTEGQIRGIWEELDIGNTGYLSKRELATVCTNIGLKELEQEELEDLFRRLDRDGDGRVSFQEFELGLSSHGPGSLPVFSTPVKQPRQLPDHQASEENGLRIATPLLLSSYVCLHPFSCIDDGSGFASPAQILSIWAQEGVENCKEILKSLDFSLEEKVSLAELAVAFDNELMVSKSGVQHAAFASYKHELHYLAAQVEQVSRERDKARLDLEKAEKRNLQLAKDVDDHHAAMEHHHESKLKDLEQDYQGKLSIIKSDVETDRALLLQQVTDQHTKLEADIKLLQGEKTSLREKLTLAVQENRGLQSEVTEVVEKLSESEKRVSKLQKELDFMLKDKLGVVDPHSTELLHQEERFAEIIKEYELQSRRVKELRDKNDELQIEVEKLRSQLQESQYRRAWRKMKENKPGGRLLPADETQRGDQSLLVSRRLSAAGKTGVLFVEADACAVSIETELMIEQLKEQLQDLKIQLETKVNYYEREIELMKRNFEKERKDIEQGFKMEVSELEEQKGDLEELKVKYQEVIDGLKDQLQKSTLSQELEKRFEKERSEMEQYYAKEICDLGQRLAQERDKLEEEMKMQHKNELQLMRMEVHRVSEDNALLRNKLGRFQEDVEEASNKQRKQIDELQREKEMALSETEELNQLNKTYKQEICQLNARTLQLSHQLSELRLRSETDHSTIQLLNQRLAQTVSQKEEEAAVAKQLQETSSKLELEFGQHQSAWQRERELLQQRLRESREKVSQVQELEVELERVTQECQTLRLMAAQFREELEESQDQLLEANTRLSLTQSQHGQELQQLKDQLESSVSRNCLAQLQRRWAEEQRKVQQLQDNLSFQAEQASRQLATFQEEHEKLLSTMEERTEELERDVRNMQRMLQEKVTQLQEQRDRNVKCDLLLKDLYVENAQLVKALQATEQRQKNAEKKNLALEEKLSALTEVIRRMAQASLGV
ncbi:ninein-like protein isoform X3 [Trachemys scripta elegans]|uniref:ninein-like protein isoform X3 n=1 Tax=Trachemys scripta elegans TaxID=31138 RepID=UPI0015551301|nr:ninein-like protein isoform X3 [Trachemys scripta elegans]